MIIAAIKAPAEAGVGVGVAVEGEKGRSIVLLKDMHQPVEDGATPPLSLHLLRNDARQLTLLMMMRELDNHLEPKTERAR